MYKLSSTALNDCLVSSVIRVIVTVTATILSHGNGAHIYSLSTFGLKLFTVFFNTVHKGGDDDVSEFVSEDTEECPLSVSDKL